MNESARRLVQRSAAWRRNFKLLTQFLESFELLVMILLAFLPEMDLQFQDDRLVIVFGRFAGIPQSRFVYRWTPLLMAVLLMAQRENNKNGQINKNSSKKKKLNFSVGRDMYLGRDGTSQREAGDFFMIGRLQGKTTPCHEKGHRMFDVPLRNLSRGTSLLSRRSIHLLSCSLVLAEEGWGRGRPPVPNIYRTFPKVFPPPSPGGGVGEVLFCQIYRSSNTKAPIGSWKKKG